MSCPLRPQPRRVKVVQDDNLKENVSPRSEQGQWLPQGYVDISVYVEPLQEFTRLRERSFTPSVLETSPTRQQAFVFR